MSVDARGGLVGGDRRSEDEQPHLDQAPHAAAQSESETRLCGAAVRQTQLRVVLHERRVHRL